MGGDEVTKFDFVRFNLVVFNPSTAERRRKKLYTAEIEFTEVSCRSVEGLALTPEYFRILYYTYSIKLLQEN